MPLDRFRMRQRARSELFTIERIRAWSIDISVLAIRQAIKISKSKGFATNFINADVLSYTPEEKFSLATDIGFHHTLPENERKHLAKHLYRQYLRRGRTLLLWCMSDEEPYYGGPHPIPKDELLSFFLEGWKIMEIRKTHLGKPGLKGLFMQAKLKGARA